MIADPGRHYKADNFRKVVCFMLYKKAVINNMFVDIRVLLLSELNQR